MPRTLPYADMDKVLSLSKRRGFVFQSSEVYGGLGSTWDYGPLGVELKRSVKEAWWRSVVSERDDVVGLDAAILMHPSGLGSQRSRGELQRPAGRVSPMPPPLPAGSARHRRVSLNAAVTSPNRAASTSCSVPSWVPVEDSSNEVFLRPETAQGIFVNFQNVQTATRKKLPFGIAQIGKAFRNEITPGNFTFRTREFEQMEIEFFVKPGSDDEWLQQWVKTRFDWYVSYGIRPGNLRLREHAGDELAHYAKATYDIEYRFPWGWGELEGIANRADFDLGRHKEFSGEDLTYFDDELHERYLPYVIEPSGGVDRATLAFWLDSYDEEPDGKDTRTVLHFHRALAPVTVAVLPLSRNARLAPTARSVYDLVRRRFRTQFDDAQSIGRRYRRQDEIGTPYCVTVDFDTLDDHAVTIRDRDTMTQQRIPIARLLDVLQDRYDHGW